MVPLVLVALCYRSDVDSLSYPKYNVTPFSASLDLPHYFATSEMSYDEIVWQIGEVKAIVSGMINSSPSNSFTLISTVICLQPLLDLRWRNNIIQIRIQRHSLN